MVDTSPQGTSRTNARLDHVARVAVLGSTGFIGTAVAEQLHARSIDVHPVVAPRLEWSKADREQIIRPREGRLGLDQHACLIETLAQSIAGADVVINAAGVADSAAPETPALFGANALLPFLASQASSIAGAKRFIHVSSIVVQGDGLLDETARAVPFSPYSWSRALGERLVSENGMLYNGTENVIFRSASVHGSDRALTRTLIRFARSPASCVAGEGFAPTPQVLVDDVAAAICHIVREPGPVPPFVLQPSNGMTTALLLRLLGGHEPRHLPTVPMRALLRCAGACASFSRRAHAHRRRLDMVLFGRPQVPGWLAERGLAPELRHGAWEELAAQSHGSGRDAPS